MRWDKPITNVGYADRGYRACHSERSEESQWVAQEILSAAKNDRRSERLWGLTRVLKIRGINHLQYVLECLYDIEKDWIVSLL